MLYPQDAITEVNNSLAVSLVIEKYFGTLNTECEVRVLLAEMERTSHEPIGICGKVTERAICVQVYAALQKEISLQITVCELVYKSLSETSNELLTTTGNDPTLYRYQTIQHTW